MALAAPICTIILSPQPCSPQSVEPESPTTASSSLLCRSFFPTLRPPNSASCTCPSSQPKDASLRLSMPPPTKAVYGQQSPGHSNSLSGRALPGHSLHAVAAEVESPTVPSYTKDYLQAEATIASPIPGVSKNVQGDDWLISTSLIEQVDHEQMRNWIEVIRGMFRNMDLGEISISAYDTAWVAMVPALDGSRGPQFPKSVEWLMKNQLPDGAWGDRDVFLAYDRLCSTLACVVALRTWDTGHENVKRGIEFMVRNLPRMEEAVDIHMPIGFEIVFPAMLEDAKAMGLQLPYDSPILQQIQSKRQQKLESNPLELLHKKATVLLHSLEGLHKDVDWSKLLKLQCQNGSFLFSPASTACALRYTGDCKCLDYLSSVLKKFNNAVPNVYPVDMFERLWMVDRLERLGVSRYFESEIKECLDYVYRFWTDQGISWTCPTPVYDVDDTAMAFRLLRLHGYDVSPDVFEHFRRNEQFCCFQTETSSTVTPMFNLYRASQTMLPGENILKEIKQFTTAFLEDKLKKKQVWDKFIISKDLHGEVDYSLKYPWYASLPRIETRQYLEQYAADDVWIGKSLYKMPHINNETFLLLAKADYNLCQLWHQQDLSQIMRWYKECEFDQLKFARQKPLECFFSSVATMFEPEFGLARYVWTRCCVLTTVLDDFFDCKGSMQELYAFMCAVERWDPSLIKGFSQDMKILFMGLYNTLNTIGHEAIILQGWNVLPHIKEIWVRWLRSIFIEAKWTHSHYAPNFEEYMDVAICSIALEPIVLPSLFFMGEKISKEATMSNDYHNIMRLVDIIGRLNNDIQGLKREISQGKSSSVTIYMLENEVTEEMAIQHCRRMIEHNMEMLVQELIRETHVLPRTCKNVHFNMAKILNFFYMKNDGFSSRNEMKRHVHSLLYSRVS